MKAIMRAGTYSTRRLETGAAVLAAAEVIDVKPVQKRLDAFAAAHQDYGRAYDAVVDAENELRARHKVLKDRDAAQDAAVEVLACAMVTDGYPRHNPFAAVGGASLYAIRRLPFGEQAKAIRTLVGLLENDTTLSDTVRRAAKAAEKAVQRMEAELFPTEKLHASLRSTRDQYATAGKTWDQALLSLKFDARAAAAGGTGAIYRALFGHSRCQGKSAATPQQPTPAPAPSAALPVALTASVASQPEPVPDTPVVSGATPLANSV